MVSKEEPRAMVDKLSFVLQECTFIISIMRKSAKSSGGPLATLLGNQFIREGSSFVDDDYGPKLPSFLKTSTKFRDDDHFLSGFVELRSILSEIESIEDVDILTLLQPFLLLIKSPKISCYITGAAVNSLNMFLKYDIVNKNRENIYQCITQSVSALSHCRFEGSDQTQDDILLVKIIQLLEQIALSELGDYLRDDSMYEIISTCLSVAINTRRREMLRSAADMALLNITEKIFRKLQYIETQSEENHNIKSTEFDMDPSDSTGLPDDTIGGTGKEKVRDSEDSSEAPQQIAVSENGDDCVTGAETEISVELKATSNNNSAEEGSSGKDEIGVTVKQKERASTDSETQSSGNTETDSAKGDITAADLEEAKPYGLPCMREYLVHTIDLLSPQNKIRFTESTRLLALEILSRIVEVCGEELQKHPTLFQLISDKCCHHLVLILRSTESGIVLSNTLKLFLDLLLNAPGHLKLQFEMFFRTIMGCIISDWSMLEKDLDNMNATVFDMSKKGKFETVTLTEEEVEEVAKEFDISKQPLSKEIIIETLSVLWCRSPYLFINLFKVYDCAFDRDDLTLSFIKLLCRLSGTDASIFTTGSVPPICMEGLLSLIEGMFERVKKGTKKGIDLSKVKTHQLLLQRSKKADFIECTKTWNKKPKKGLSLLQEKGFIKDLQDGKEVANFLFEMSRRIDKTKLGELMGEPENIDLLKEFISQMDFRNLRPDEALRLMLSNFRLPGEAQQISRIVECFNEGYMNCQDNSAVEKKEKNFDSKDTNGEGEKEEKVVPGKDALFVLSFSIILLNTDLHNPNVKKPMTVEEYQKNLRGCYNGGDFPSWYTERIYYSIKEKEIVMPEDFKGSSKWLESEWHTLIAEQESKITSGSEMGSLVSINGESLEVLLQFDRRIFKNTAKYIISTLVTAFDNSTNDSIITRMMSSVEKCATIAIFFKMDDIVDSIVDIVAHMTTLTGVKRSQFALEFGEEVPTVQLSPERGETGEDESITISKLSVLFGRDLRAQVSLIVLLRIVRRTGFRVSEQWQNIIKIALKLFEIDLIDPNCFPEFQSKLNLGKLTVPKAEYTLNRSNSLKDSSIFSTFSSYLKGLSDDTPEPTEEEIECTMSTIECVKSSNLKDLFRSVSKTTTKNMDSFVSLLLNSLPSKEENKDPAFVEKTLFLLESCVCYLIISGNTELISRLLDICDGLFDAELKISTSALARLTAYELLLLHNGSISHEDLLQRCLDRLTSSLDKNRDMFLRHSLPILQPLEMLVITKGSWCGKSLAANSSYWSILRAFASGTKNTASVYSFMESVLDKRSELINYENYMDILGLLDEISAVGAYGAQWEQEYDKLTASGVDVERNKNPFQELVNTACKSIYLTAKLAQIIETPAFLKSMKPSAEEDEQGKKQASPWYPLIEAISHQCYNPCREVRDCALRTLTSLLVSDGLPIEKLSPEAVVDSGCFRLILEVLNPEVTVTDPNGMLKTQQDVINLGCKSIMLYKFEDLNQQVAKLLTLTDKLLNANVKQVDFQDEVLEIIKNALTVKADELDFEKLSGVKMSQPLRKMLATVSKEKIKE
ncbi:hypothetical protein FOA43_000785 [Brettanomyces nanus]|uniref:SEC7 domain-containing protein n=1 Tax=Eeniella nana TaxID=13502 RepID=A0A875S291_EENNA|nr:uncharacterized protein FOA43_000785 [Brettanomyces nanus]QPG73474.1 hypothetical protein FOA43_000785 [Brettanomyces nanus]